MSTSPRSFWTTTAGVVTGLAGVLTAIVGLLTVSVQMGWIGSKNNNGNAQPAASANGTSTTLSSGASTTANGLAGFSTTTAGGQLSVTPTKVTFPALGDRDQQVKVSNVGTGPLDLRTPYVDGTDKAQFTVSG